MYNKHGFVKTLYITRCDVYRAEKGDVTKSTMDIMGRYSLPEAEKLLRKETMNPTLTVISAKKLKKMYEISAEDFFAAAKEI